jgi:hypothetical protein
MRAMIASALLLASAAASSATIDVGNVAPGSGEVRMLFADQETGALPYLDFQRIQHDAGPIEVTAVGEGGRVMAEARFELQNTPDVQAMVVLVGNGTEAAPWKIRLFDGTRDSETVPSIPSSEAKSKSAKAAIGSAVTIHHFAPFDGATDGSEFEAVAACRAQDSVGTLATPIRVSQYGESVVTVYTHEGDFTCTFKSADRRFGAFDFSMPLGSGTLRFLLVGDGASEPTRVMVLQDGAVVRLASETTPAIGAVTRSEDFWYDLARPAQGLGLYELPGSENVFGTWFTHDEDGEPVWYLLDGVATDIPGQREFTVYRFTRSGAARSAAAAGSARLFYLDCNQAELRILLGDTDYVTLRIRRSREVASCEALD